MKFSNAYSIKTNPDPRLIKSALDSGFLAEAISLLEVNRAIELGFQPGQIILNGPGKWWRDEFLPTEQIYAVFCDSIADLQRVVRAISSGELRAMIAGVRLRTPQISSRFGIPVDSPKAFRDLIDAVRLLPQECAFGVHFHMASSNVGVKQWWHLFQSMLQWNASIETLTQRPIEILDMGGGWFPDDWDENSNEVFIESIAQILKYLPHVKQIITEPGKALAQPSMALAMRILEVQDNLASAKGVVVDGSIAELPMHFFQPHRILHQNAKTGAWSSVGYGRTSLLGRLCMEHDIVAYNVELPTDAEAGDLIVVCDAGAYDRSMSYAFGRG